MSEQVKVSESIRLGTLLAFSGGFLDAYTFMTRDGTFANAETGNIVWWGFMRRWENMENRCII